MQGKSLYDPSLEHDSCGVGCVVDYSGKKSHSVVSDALTMLENMEHRGATGSDPNTGDGAGVLVQVPHEFFQEKMGDFGIKLPGEKEYGVGMFFFPKHYETREECRKVVNDCIEKSGLKLIGYRLVPVDESVPGHESKAVEPYIEQVFVVPNEKLSAEELERKLFVLGNYATHEVQRNVAGENNQFYICSFSSNTIVYKGQLRTDQLPKYFHDLRDPNFKSALATVHSRFSTNTFPRWSLAQPFRVIAHNGEINTIRGNVNKMKSKEALMTSPYYSDEELKWLLPVTDPKNSDSANLDAIVELLALSGRSLPHTMMMVVPEAWQDNDQMDSARKAFYKYHAAMMEPWDGPAALFFTNGSLIGATLDRSGLRPVRYCITSENRLVMASEVGVINIDQSKVIEKGRLQPGKMLIADLKENKIYKDDDAKAKVVEGKPYTEWINNKRIRLREIEVPEFDIPKLSSGQLLSEMKAYGYTQEDVKMTIEPMASKAIEPVGSMGADSPIPPLSRQSQSVSNYFKQFFAQVSNPPIDPIRERMVMSLFTRLGESLNILDETEEHTKQIHISQPALTRSAFSKLTQLEGRGFKATTIDSTYNPKEQNLEEALDTISRQSEEAANAGNCILIVSNRNISKDRVPIPSLLATGAIHHYLIDKRIRTKTGLVIEGGDIWETHHFATIVGYGASCIFPFRVYDILDQLYDEKVLDNSKPIDDYYENYRYGIGKGLLKILSKMGISTLQSYQSAQIFECVGLGPDVIEKCFKGTLSRLDGLTFEGLEKECLAKHNAAYPGKDTKNILEVGGFFQWKQNGEGHLLSPETIHLLQKSTRLNDYELFKKYSSSIYDHQSKLYTLRSLFEFKKRKSVPIEEVEPVEGILKRFATGAMSFGSISHEAHSTLAIAMNRIGGKSNSGEGGEDEARFVRKENGDYERSAIKQVASGRFGVNSYYLSEAEEIQIKIAQGAKPGEGGQLPGHKVDHWIARVRFSTPGVGLISPPPHHDIYSIEDLKQLIYDLKNANPNARINVKLVSEAGVGTIASGVSKAKADVILVSGYDGGTGASPLSSIRHAGLPWEIGLSEAHQTLVKNNLRSRVVLQTDGKMMTGRDVAIATLLGAEEYGFSTTALIVEGCIMMRKCHLNTCPVGIATQNPELRKLFTGDPDHVVNFFNFIAMELREIMAELGFRTVNEMVGRAKTLKVRSDLEHWKLQSLDLSPILYEKEVNSNVGLYNQFEQDHELEDILDRKLIVDWKAGKSETDYPIINTDRAVGAMLSYEISLQHQAKGLGDSDAFTVNFNGSAGQSFGVFLAKGVKFNLEGEANDYVGKGLSGGKVVIKPPKESTFVPHENIIIGNVAFYGATSGKAFINGLGGERFCVRNSGVHAVVEGVGDHGCEYMTGGKVLILGNVGKNFAAGMSGGIAYVFNPNDTFEVNCNREMVDIDPLDDNDFADVKAMIEEHLAETDSKMASYILNDWEALSKYFIKVMPHDLKRVMAEQQQKEEKVA
ncbi:MAG: glutamate synthase large subunit [Cyclobacteriaceae bacterium]